MKTANNPRFTPFLVAQAKSHLEFLKELLIGQ
jgi:hypothetical protein